MNVSLLTISNSEVITSTPNKVVGLISSTLYKSGYNVLENSVIKVDSELINTKVQSFKSDINDCLLIFMQNQAEYAYATKKIIASTFEDEIINNIYAKNSIANYYKVKNVPMPKEAMSHANMPKSARAIINDLGALQGFLMEYKNKLLVFMPHAASELKDMFIKSVLPYLLENLKETARTIIFKTFGLTFNEITSLLKDVIKNKQKISIVCNENLLDAEIIINFPEKTDKLVLDGLVTTIYKILGEFIYADSDVTLPECLNSLLTMQKKVVACAEDSTHGEVSRTIEDVNSALLSEGYIVPNNISKVKLLGVDKELFSRVNTDANEVVYQMAVGALENSGSDYVISTYHKSDTMYLALGTSEGIHVYTQNYVGTAEEKIHKFTNYTIFNLIKKIKKNDFNLMQNVVQ